MTVVVAILISLLSSSCASGVGSAWEISSANSDYTTHPTWPRLDLSAFEVRSISGIGRLSRETTMRPTELLDSEEPEAEGSNRVAKDVEDMENSSQEILYDHPIFKGVAKNPKDVEMLPGPWEKTRKRRKGRYHGTCAESNEDKVEEHSRIRRDVEETPMEKVSATKNVREPRLSSPESWSKQQISVEFRRSRDEASDEEDETSHAPQSHEAPRTDFITASRRNYDVRESRESREFPQSRTYDDVSYRTPRRNHEYDESYSRGYYYPEHFRTEREYYVRGLSEPTAYSSDRYRIEDYDLFKNRPTPKPKRIIYYATLPEVVRKPIDLRSYQRPYDSMGRPPIPMMTRDGFPKKFPNMMDRDAEGRYRYRSYPYNSYDAHIKRSGYLERPYMSYDRVEDDRYLDQDLDHASYKEARAADESVNLTDSGMRRQEKLPWPVQIGTEINIKDNQKVSGRKIYGQYQDYERFRLNSRADLKENRENPGIETRN